MSDIGRYRKLYARLWRHPGFAELSDGEKILALYLLTGPQTNRLGLYCLSVATAAEDLGTLPGTLTKRLVKVCLTFKWLFDSRARVLYVPSWFKWNPPENVNVMKGSLKDLNEIPPCGLVDAFARNHEALPQTLHETFIEGLRQRLPKGMPTQEQEAVTVAETGKQKLALTPEKQRALRTALAERTEDKNSIEEKHLKVARDAVLLTNDRAPMEELLNAFGGVARHEQVTYTKGQATKALSSVLMDRGQLRAVGA